MEREKEMKRFCCILLTIFLLTGVASPVAYAAPREGINSGSSLTLAQVGMNASTTSISGFQTTPMVSAGARHSMALHSDGTVWTWGHNTSGQLGIGISGDANFRTFPQQIPNLNNIIQVSGGGAHSLALRSDGTVWAWGDNFFGQLGNGSFGRLFDEGGSSPTQVRNLTNVIAISAGQRHNMALRSDGTVWTWGSNTSGELGDGNSGLDAHRNLPAQVSGLNNVTYISGGDIHSAVVRNDGTVWTWGGNSLGQLGDGTTIDRLTPVQAIGLTDAVTVSAASFLTGGQTVALRSDGSVWTWGNVFYFQGHYPTHYNMQPMPAVTRAVSAGSGHVVIICENNLVYAWGLNTNAQLGVGSYGQAVAGSDGNPFGSHGWNNPLDVRCPSDTNIPPTLRFDAVVAISTSCSHTLAIRADGSVWSWGANDRGQGGVGNTKAQHRNPIQVLGAGGSGFLNLRAQAAQPPQQQAGSLPFRDVNSGDWFYPYVQAMYRNGIMQGMDATTFAPHVSLSRIQIVAMLFRIQNGQPATHRPYVDLAPHGFSDVNHGGWFAPYVAWAEANHISAGSGAPPLAVRLGPRFAPNESVQRQEIAMLMHNYVANMTGLNRVGTSTAQWNNFADRYQIGGNAEYNGLMWANNHDIIRGRGATIIAPTATATRAEAAAMMYRLMNHVRNAPPPAPGQTMQGAVPPGFQPAESVQPEPPQPPEQPHATNASTFEQRILELANIERARYGLAPLQWDAALGAAARAHSVDMATRLFFDHVCPSGNDLSSRGAHGENIGLGQQTPEEVVYRWMGSPGHRANILNPNFTHMGAGFHVGQTRIPNYSQARPYFWTQKFLVR